MVACEGEVTKNWVIFRDFNLLAPSILVLEVAKSHKMLQLEMFLKKDTCNY